MRLSVVVLLAASFALSVHTCTCANSKAIDEIAEGGRTFLRGLDSLEEGPDNDDSEEERGIKKFPTLEKLKNLRKVERIKEIEEALALAKIEVKAAAEAAAKAAKAQKIAAISEQLDDATVQKILKDPEVKNAVFAAWHQAKLDPQLVFNAFALPGKYTAAKWDRIAIAYLNYVT
ncbi:hypothetical protein P3T76_004312 [Phytophthora citrophthora]|uniref:RxLR effector protein n=1 Tax=Phytophthora citrophthora TaxID=4793 RepID=A0AAD9GTP6_9STRA|nr:hypothetical protein P3T76_004312 [Phytophthora citrophthora]